jgi:hypothetical protein
MNHNCEEVSILGPEWYHKSNGSGWGLRYPREVMRF